MSEKNLLEIHIKGLYYVYEGRGDPMGRTNVVIDDELVDECLQLTGIRTRRALIDHAPREVRRRGRRKRLLELKGTIEWEGDLAKWRKVRD